MENYELTLFIEDNTIIVTSENATKPFKLHSIDIEFIECDIIKHGSNQGYLNVIVDEGLIMVEWHTER